MGDFFGVRGAPVTGFAVLRANPAPGVGILVTGTRGCARVARLPPGFVLPAFQALSYWFEDAFVFSERGFGWMAGVFLSDGSDGSD